MKKLLYITIAAIALLSFASCSSTRTFRNDVTISWDQLSADASLRQFKKANKQNQIEILHNLISRAEEEFYKCKTIEDLDHLNDQMELIRFFNNQAKMKSTSITGQINSLQRKIDRVVREFSGQGVVNIEGLNRDSYSSYGQDIY